MKITYTGKHEKLYPAQTEKLNVKFSKLAKLLDSKGEKNAHVILTSDRSFHRAEITVNYMERALVGEAKNSEQFLAINGAIEKLEKQVLKIREKRRDPKKSSTTQAKEAALSTAEEATAVLGQKPEKASKAKIGSSPNGTVKPRVFQVDHREDRKPMTLDEAMMELERPGDYVVYRDAKKDCLSVLVRRPDGNFDLIEG